MVFTWMHEKEGAQVSLEGCSTTQHHVCIQAKRFRYVQAVSTNIDALLTLTVLWIIASLFKSSLQIANTYKLIAAQPLSCLSAMHVVQFALTVRPAIPVRVLAPKLPPTFEYAGPQAGPN